ncbi:alpha/beta-hydrolase [Fomitiporia mediterranea MF3/22]|uniref:alpha/beta-hydrolase n=1 Tax=Fomitiporia mediterranea (strain MF3/22) TaxID=694068 RepID=UPI0004409A73|nr:alpha/beta-hydrolase [Fomitiporia mediterranea MF3/22]EJD03380.1 alpha/beta-hydrolase [Fomitiporia mediterranea MF3/22]
MSQFPPSSKILVSSDGAKIYADASGDPSKPSIVFVHGQGLSGAVFDKIFSDKRYTENFYLVHLINVVYSQDTYHFVDLKVRYDMRAHGRSDKPVIKEGYTSKLFADDFVAVMKAFNLHKPVFVGWSLGATIPVDIAANFSDNPLALIVYLCGIPYIGPIIQRVATPEILSMIPNLTSEDSVATTLSATREYVDSLFSDATKIPWELRVLWFGMTALRRPIHVQLSLSREQDPSRFFELGKQGLPLFILGGKYDRQIMSNVVADEMRPYFKNMEVHLIEKGGSHCVFFENQGETMDKIIEFARSVNGHGNDLTNGV